GGHPAAITGGQDNLVGLGDQIADGQHEALVADDHGVADPLRSEGLGGEGVVAHLGFKGDDGR
ncbi:hypothetical protein CPI28_02635, partial [Moraxella catarrhalis]|nr:hypothetical protein [Moraxella catarrhalis]